MERWSKLPIDHDNLLRSHYQLVIVFVLRCTMYAVEAASLNNMHLSELSSSFHFCLLFVEKFFHELRRINFRTEAWIRTFLYTSNSYAFCKEKWTKIGCASRNWISLNWQFPIALIYIHGYSNIDSVSRIALHFYSVINLLVRNLVYLSKLYIYF
jgi:hypothetical protein